MAATLISNALDQIPLVLDQDQNRNTRLVTGVDKELEALCSSLQAILPMLADAERRQHKEEIVGNWLLKLKGAAYQLDDVLDEWITALHQHQIARGDEEGAAPSSSSLCDLFCSMMNKVLPFISSLTAGNVQGREIDVKMKGIALRIKKLHQMLGDIAKEAEGCHFSSSEPIDSPIDAPAFDMTEVIGREQEKSILMGKLLGEESDQKKAPHTRIIPIVGKRGVGKTTLAKLVYNEPEVRKHFRKRIWAYVSEHCDEIKIGNVILESLNNDNGDNLKEIFGEIRRLVEGKKVLLVLDDVWIQDFRKWVQMKQYLVSLGSPGSAILVTTHKVKVAKIVCSNKNDIFPLRELSSGSCWEIISRIALAGRMGRECESLEVIGKKIVAKCRHLPLAVKLLAGLLRFRRSTEWESVLDSKIWEYEQDGGKEFFAPPLWLSYFELPLPLRPCFAYCASFFKDAKVTVQELIERWMALGYLNATENEDMEMVGEQYFQNLAARFLLRDVKNDCKIHDVVHDFAQLVARNESFTLEIKGAEEPMIEPWQQAGARHVMVSINSVLPSTLFSFKGLRSLSIVYIRGGNPAIKEALPKLFDELVCLRSLDLVVCTIEEIPSSINKLIHLRRLYLACNAWFVEWPETICELRNLQTLDVSSCFFGNWPQQIGKLIKLRHLYLPSACYFVEGGYIPKSVGELTNLRTLGWFVISYNDDNTTAAASLEDLKSLNLLQGQLGIHRLGNVREADLVEAKQGRILGEKHGIRDLELQFCADYGSEAGPADHEAALEVLEPSPNLQSLNILHYEGTTMLMSWNLTSLTNLRALDLQHCPNCEHLGPLGKLPSLESLYLTVMSSITKLGAEFLGADTSTTSYGSDQISSSASSSSSVVLLFPKLARLEFSGMHEWKEWTGVVRTSTDKDSRGNVMIMPCLRSLRISWCPELKALPDYILENEVLEELEISDCDKLRECYGKETGEDWLKISRIPKVTIVDNYGPQIDDYAGEDDNGSSIWGDDDDGGDFE